MIYEERRVIVDAKRLNEYLSACQSDLFPAIRDAGGDVICQLSGLIGNPQNELVQITVWQSTDDWQDFQAIDTGLSDMVQSEAVRLLRAISLRPKAEIPAEDRRPVYGFRRFFIEPPDLDEFVHCSENGIWPRIESMGACILGLWTTVAATNPQEIVLATGYHSPSNWEYTRYGDERPEGVDETLWRNEEALRRRRIEMSLKSWVCLMRAHDVS
ncbi:MAG: hypothetical protein OXI16_12340 [Chloroflexota bacterium]|nr:hypothetical protein [Chloroflexota bacterium]